MNTPYKTELNHGLLYKPLNQHSQTIDKLYTYYNSAGGWYLKINNKLAPRITVEVESNTFTFYLWNADYTNAEKLFTVFTLTGQNREEQSLSDEKFVL